MTALEHMADLRAGSDRLLLSGLAITRYTEDPEYRASVNAEKALRETAHQKTIDASLIGSDNRWPAHWTDAEKDAATAQLIGGK